MNNSFSILKKISHFLVIAGLFSCKAESQGSVDVIYLEFQIDKDSNLINAGDTIQIEELNSMGKLIKRTSINKSEFGLFKEISYYDKNGKESRRVAMYNNTDTVITDTKRDFYGHIVELRTYTPNDTDTLIYKYSHDFNKDSSVDRVTVTDVKSGSVMEYYEDWYNERNQIIKSVNWTLEDSGKKVESVNEYKYDQNANKILERREDKINARIFTDVFVYDKLNRLIKGTYYKNDTIQYEINFEYDGMKKKGAVKQVPSRNELFKIRVVYK